MANLAGILSTRDASSNELAGEYQESVFVRNSKGYNVGGTLFGLMSRLKNEPAENIEYNWFERDPVRKVIYTNQAGDNGTATQIIFDDGATNPVWQLLEDGHILFNESTGEFARVNGTPTSSTVTLQRAIFDSDSVTGNSSADNDPWVIVTLGKLEGATARRASYEDPSTIKNYIQTFNSAVEITNAFKGSVLRTDLEGPLTERRIQALEQISKDIEFSFFFGPRLQGSATVPYLTGGIYYALVAANNNTRAVQAAAPSGGLIKGATTTGAITRANLDAWMQQFMVNGSDAKIAFCGPKAYAAFSSYAGNQANGYRIMQSETVFGMHITVINTPFGEINLAMHPLFKEATASVNPATAGGLTAFMVVVDLAMLVQKVFEPLFLEPNIQIPGSDSYKEQYRAKLGLKLRFPQAFGVAENLQSIT